MTDMESILACGLTLEERAEFDRVTRLLLLGGHLHPERPTAMRMRNALCETMRRRAFDDPR